MLRRLTRATRPAALALTAGAAGVLVAATPAAAHVDRADNGVWDGILHPITGVDHLLAMVAVGVVAVVASPRRGRWAPPLAFLGGMLGGGLAGLVDLPLPGAELLIVLSVLLLGVAIAGATRGRGDWVLALVAAAGLAHGHAHGAEAPEASNPVGYVLGFLAATASLHVAGVLVGLAIQDRRTMRVGLGATTAAAAALLLTA